MSTVRASVALALLLLAMAPLAAAGDDGGAPGDAKCVRTRTVDSETQSFTPVAQPGSAIVVGYVYNYQETTVTVTPGACGADAFRIVSGGTSTQGTLLPPVPLLP